MYQICRSLAYIHQMGICHRDIKPQNLLLNAKSHDVKLCDFGSAKMLVKGEPNVSYICSRYYRAPELVFEATEYTCTIGKASEQISFSVWNVQTCFFLLLFRFQTYGLWDVSWLSYYSGRLYSLVTVV